jgi:hypothetical protein
MTDQGIGFNMEGRLVDGQQRCAAVVDSGVAVMMLVISGLTEAAVLNGIDNNIPRTAAHRLAIARPGEKYVGTKASICRMLAVLTNPDLSYSYKPQHHQIDGVLDQFTEAVELVSARRKMASRIPAITRAVAVVMMDRSPKGMEWFEGVDSGEGLASGDPRLLFRTWLMSRGTNEIGPLFSRSITSAHAYLNGERLRKLQIGARSRYEAWARAMSLPVNTSLLSAITLERGV